MSVYPYKIKPKESYLNIDLIIYYESFISGTKKYFESDYKYFISIQNLKLGNQGEPISIIHKDNIYPIPIKKRILNHIDFLEKEKGSAVFTFLESEQHPSMNSQFITSQTKLVFFDPIKRDIVFKRINFIGNEQILIGNIKKKVDYHTVGITWQKYSGYLYIDGMIAAKDTILKIQ